MQKEIWKDIPGYEGLYQVSNLGRVMSNKGGVLNQTTSKGYFRLKLCKEGIKTWWTHQLVAMTFLDHVTCGMRLVVDHINGIKTDNRVENLQIVTQRVNMEKANRKGLTSKYTGVSWFKRDQKWRANIFINGKQIHLGYFDSENEASNAYQKTLKEVDMKYDPCPDCSGTGTIDIECTTYHNDPYSTPEYRTEQCPDCDDGTIENEDYEMPELKQIGEDFDNLNLNFLK